MKKILKYLTLITILPIISYFLLSYLLMFFPKKVTTNEPKNKSVYILYSAMHTDIVFNIEELKQPILKEFQEKKKGYLSFGWGDKGIYMNTPTWAEINLLTALKALFVKTPSIMHIGYYPNILRYSEIKKIDLTEEQLAQLEVTIMNDFANKKAYQGYTQSDFFYDAKNSYTLFNTCNTWTGEKLRKADVSISYWTPLSQNITASLP